MIQEIYVSTDVETNGPIPGTYSMLSIGSAAYMADGTLLDTYTANLELLSQAKQDAVTMQWWQGYPDAWEAARANLRPAEEVMNEYVVWLEDLPGKPVFVGYPAGFDFTFVYWYLIQFAGKSPFSFSALDVKTYAMAVMKLPYRKTVKKAMPGSWLSELPHTHLALEDAIEQGALFCKILQKNLSQG